MLLVASGRLGERRDYPSSSFIFVGVARRIKRSNTTCGWWRPTPLFDLWLHTVMTWGYKSSVCWMIHIGSAVSAIPTGQRWSRWSTLDQWAPASLRVFLAAAKEEVAGVGGKCCTSFAHAYLVNWTQVEYDLGDIGIACAQTLVRDVTLPVWQRHF